MLHLAAAILSLLLLAGAFGTRTDTDDDAPVTPADNIMVGRHARDVDGMP